MSSNSSSKGGGRPTLGRGFAVPSDGGPTETLETLEIPVGEVLVLDPEGANGAVIKDILEHDGHRVHVVDSLVRGISRLLQGGIDILIVDPFAGDAPGLAFLDRLPRGRETNGLEIIIVTSRDDVETAVTALHRGAIDYLVKPVNSDRLRLSVVRALEQRMLVSENARLKRDLSLFSSAQRLMETLDLGQLAARGLDILSSYTGATGALLMDPDKAIEHRGLGEEEIAHLVATAPAQTLAAVPGSFGESFERFRDAMVLEISHARRVLLFRSDARFTEAEREDAMFLGRQLSSAMDNCIRFASAERRARRDPLTGQYNARAFQEAVHQACVRSVVDGTEFSVLFMDLDHFKEVNDTHGHLMGSQLIVEIANLLVRSLRDGSIVGRYGGDEFVVLLPNTGRNGSLAVAERLRRQVESHYFLTREGLGVNLTLCVGIANYPDHGKSARQILDQADRAMYLGKQASRNAVHLPPDPADDKIQGVRTAASDRQEDSGE